MRTPRNLAPVRGTIDHRAAHGRGDVPLPRRVGRRPHAPRPGSQAAARLVDRVEVEVHDPRERLPLRQPELRFARRQGPHTAEVVPRPLGHVDGDRDDGRGALRRLLDSRLDLLPEIRRPQRLRLRHPVLARLDEPRLREHASRDRRVLRMQPSRTDTRLDRRPRRGRWRSVRRVRGSDRRRIERAPQVHQRTRLRRGHPESHGELDDGRALGQRVGPSPFDLQQDAREPESDVEVLGRHLRRPSLRLAVRRGVDPAAVRQDARRGVGCIVLAHTNRRLSRPGDTLCGPGHAARFPACIAAASLSLVGGATK